MQKTQIVIDADVIIHFSKGGYLHLLPEIFPNYECIVLSKVYDEIKCDIRKELDNIILFLKKISVVDFNPKGEMLREYAMLTKTRGIGESACMAYCRFTNNVVGSSNRKDISNYCDTYQITHIGTMDFLYFAVKHGKMSIEEAKQCFNDIINKGSKLPAEDFDHYIPQTTLI